jgi:SAM-dependent methyltransferase
MTSFAEFVHQSYVAPRRVRILAGHLAPLLPDKARVLDVGCGDGEVSAAILELRPDLHVEGVEVLLRGKPRIKVSAYDGRRLPFLDKSLDAVMFVDVLHHTVDPAQLLREAARVATKCVIIKDHTAEGIFALATLRFLDRVGNVRHGVALPYNYWRRSQWTEELQLARLLPVSWNAKLHLYPWPASVLFERRLQFVAQLAVM